MAQNPSQQPPNPAEQPQNPPVSPTNQQVPPTPAAPPPASPQMPPVPPMPPEYPADLTIDYPDHPLNRLTTFFRIFVAIPILIILGLLSGPAQRWGQDNSRVMYETTRGAILFIPVILMILFRKKYPKWWYDWNLEFTKFSTRVGSYLLLMRDEYPSTDEEQAVHIYLPYPDASQLSRGLPLVKWFLTIPHFIILGFLAIAVIVIVVIAWFAILFTGNYPKGMFNFVVGVMRWALRVQAYAILLTTDRYPPFSLT